jgi:hypothetical protein
VREWDAGGHREAPTYEQAERTRRRQRAAHDLAAQANGESKGKPSGRAAARRRGAARKR